MDKRSQIISEIKNLAYDEKMKIIDEKDITSNKIKAKYDKKNYDRDCSYEMKMLLGGFKESLNGINNLDRFFIISWAFYIMISPEYEKVIEKLDQDSSIYSQNNMYKFLYNFRNLDIVKKLFGLTYATLTDEDKLLAKMHETVTKPLIDDFHILEL